MLNGQEDILTLLKKFPQTREIFTKFGIEIPLKSSKDSKLSALALRYKIPLQLLLNHLAKATGQDIAWPKVSGLKTSEGSSTNVFSASTTLRSGNIPGIKKFIAIHSGKGGVGKTFIAVNLALYLANRGLKVGMIDLDIDCPNVMRMLSLEGRLYTNAQKKIAPLEKFDIKVISMAAIQENPEQAILWRGPVLTKVVEQFLYDTEWGELDLLIADLPPGTGDIPITLLNILKLDGVISVTTPQDLALLDTLKSINMCKNFHIPLLGIIENMTGEIFGKPQVENSSSFKDITYLGNIPLLKDYNARNHSSLYGNLTADSKLQAIFERVQEILNFD